jgi:hypothetical protein
MIHLDKDMNFRDFVVGEVRCKSLHPKHYVLAEACLLLEINISVWVQMALSWRSIIYSFCCTTSSLAEKKDSLACGVLL